MNKDSIFAYKCTRLFKKSAECGVRFDDSDLGIRWDLKGLNGSRLVVSEKDKLLPPLSGALDEFTYSSIF